MLYRYHHAVQEKAVRGLMRSPCGVRTQSNLICVLNVLEISIGCTSLLSRRCAVGWAMLESNQRPQACHACTLTN